MSLMRLLPRYLESSDNMILAEIVQIDTDKSDTIDFNEFVKIMTWLIK